MHWSSESLRRKVLRLREPLPFFPRTCRTRTKRPRQRRSRRRPGASRKDCREGTFPPPAPKQRSRFGGAGQAHRGPGQPPPLLPPLLKHSFKIAACVQIRLYTLVSSQGTGLRIAGFSTVSGGQQGAFCALWSAERWSQGSQEQRSQQLHAQTSAARAKTSSHSLRAHQFRILTLPFGAWTFRTPFRGLGCVTVSIWGWGPRELAALRAPFPLLLWSWRYRVFRLDSLLGFRFFRNWSLVLGLRKNSTPCRVLGVCNSFLLTFRVWVLLTSGFRVFAPRTPFRV